MRCLLRSCGALLFVTSLVACAEPPNKEMNQAQGAIDTARAAGAEQYAAAEFTAAVDALTRSRDAVGQRDYRLALGLAIDSRERAQEAAKVAVETRAKARGDAERVVARTSLLLSQALERLKDPDVLRLPRRTLTEPRQTIASVEKTMQEARAALASDDYRRAIDLTEGLSDRIQQAVTAIDDARAAQATRRRR